MLFEVIGPDGRIKARCNDERMMPTQEQARQMADAGYKFRLDGKVWRPQKAVKERNGCSGHMIRSAKEEQK